ncbi:hypothetical protein ACQ86B_06015 [Mycolicibacterium aichiense]|uniref:hypothetical protein n=1 Tax=Mycolicibacterium aichiense TaxID=1799 RepID=UPI003D66EA26
MRLRAGGNSPAGGFQIGLDKRREQREIARESREEQRAIAKEEREEEKEKREARSAKITSRLAIAAVVVSLLTSLITATIALRTTQQSLLFGESQSDRNSTRDHRQASYADFYTAAMQFIAVAAWMCMPPGSDHPNPMPGSLTVSAPDSEEALSPDLSVRTKALTDKFATLNAKLAVLLITASSKVAYDAQVFAQVLTGNFMTVALTLAKAAVKDPPRLARRLPDFYDALPPVEEWAAYFVSDARKEFGVLPLAAPDHRQHLNQANLSPGRR